MIVEEVQGEHIMRVGVGDNIGARYPAHTTSTGKLMLAALSDDELKDVLPNKLMAVTPLSITDRLLLREELAQVRQQGWAQSWEELEIGLAAVGAPVHGRDGGTIAAVSISGPTVRIDRSNLKNLAIMVLDTTKRISRDLGFARK
jgi:DNA-binding IclR family transcriptional regulator